MNHPRCLNSSECSRVNKKKGVLLLLSRRGRLPSHVVNKSQSQCVKLGPPCPHLLWLPYLISGLTASAFLLKLTSIFPSSFLLLGIQIRSLYISTYINYPSHHLPKFSYLGFPLLISIPDYSYSFQSILWCNICVYGNSWNMGVKFLSFHMIPWYCFFNNMGGHISCVHPPQPHSDKGIYSGKTEAASRSVKLIRADGRVKIYHRPIMAGELMLEFPKHLVCHADSFFIGQKVPPLSETDRLKLGHKYFLLPRQFFQSVLTFVTIASFASVDNEDSSSSKKKEIVKKLAATCKPFDIQKSPSGSMQIRVSDEFISKLMEDGRESDQDESDQDCMLDVKKEKKLVCTTPQLQKDYSQLVEFRRSIQWRPKLETITEKDRKKPKYARLKMKIKKNSKVKSHSKSDHKQVKIHMLEKEEEKKLKKAKKLESKEKRKEMKMEKKLDKKRRRLDRKKKKNVLVDEEKETGSKLVHRTVPTPPPPPPPPPPIRTFSSKIKWNMKKKETKLVHSIPTPPPLPPPPKIRMLSSKIKWKKEKEEKETKLVHSIPPPPPPPPSIRTFSSKIKWRKKKSASS